MAEHPALHLEPLTNAFEVRRRFTHLEQP